MPHRFFPSPPAQLLRRLACGAASTALLAAALSAPLSAAADGNGTAAEEDKESAPPALRAEAAAAAESAPAEAQAGRTVRIGVESTLDPIFFVGAFGPAMAHLREAFPNRVFEAAFLPMPDLLDAIEAKRLDFFFSESGLYAYAHAACGAKDVAVRRSPMSRDPSRAASAAVVVRADWRPEAGRAPRLEDLRGKRIAAESPASFEGWTVLQGLIAEAGEDPEHFFGETIFTGGELPGPAALVAAGAADAAVLPACELERLMASHGIDEKALRVLAPQSGTELRCLRSAPLYPDVVFASTPAADPEFVRLATIALLSQPPSPEGYAWGVGTDFEAVDALFRRLKAGPYSYLREANWRAFWENYREWILAAGALLFLGLLHIVRTNRLVALRTSQLRHALLRRDELEEEAKASRQRLSAMERAGVVSQMSAMLAHEVRQPVTSLVNFAGGLEMYAERKYGGDPVIAEAASLITEEAERVSSIVERVRRYAKERRSRRERLAAPSLVQAALRTFSHSSTASGVTAVNAGGPAEAAVSGDPLELELVLLNLLKNAAAAVQALSPDRRRIRILWTLEPAALVFTVEDGGPELSDEAFSRLAEPTESLKPDGLGLGLSLCRTIAERHGGGLSFRRLHPGLAASLRLPPAPPEAAAPEGLDSGEKRTEEAWSAQKSEEMSAVKDAKKADEAAAAAADAAAGPEERREERRGSDD